MAKPRMSEQECFGSVVRSHRLALDLSQEQLADRVGIHRTYIGSVERGERNVSLLNIYAIARALGTTPATLFTEADKLMTKGPK